MKILGTGLSGLVGSRIVELLSDGYSYENLSLETGVDITDKKTVDDYFAHFKGDWVFHLAAYTDVQGAEKEKDQKEESVSWKINVRATEHIVENCKKYHKNLLYLDTDYAFDGKKMQYTENDMPNPLGWYAKTKYEGALRVLSLEKQGLVIRISNPYRAHPVGKKDFVHKMLERLLSGEHVIAPEDQLFCPTFIDDIASAIRVLITKKASGVYHVVGSPAISPFDAALCIADQYGIDRGLVDGTTYALLFQNRAPVPQWANLSVEKIRAFGITPRSFARGLAEMKTQEQMPK